MNLKNLLLVALAIAIGVLIIRQWSGITRKHHHHDRPSVLLINVLDKEFFDDCHIKAVGTARSINVPLEQLESYAHANISKKTPVVVYCANYKCLASSEGAKMLQELGFTDVWAYEGGTAEWKNLGYPTNGPGKQPYLDDLEKAGDLPASEGVRIISAQELKEKMESQPRCC
jgi:rhodanese-related sulfurtransferase